MTRREPELRDGRAAAAYVAELTADLAEIARGHGLHTLGFLLDMAHLEAEQEMQAAAPGDGRVLSQE
jgi:hypothetical protein